MKALARAAVLALCCSVAGAAWPAEQPGRAGTVVLDPMLSKVGPGDVVLWIGYAARMSNYLNETGAAAALTGRYEPSFDAEVNAREAQASAWREINQKKPERSVYGDDIVRVQAAGYMREYVWRYYRRPAWGEAPAELKLAEFDAWARDQLASHVPYTGAYLDFRIKPAA
jgi:hypothetical protein